MVAPVLYRRTKNAQKDGESNVDTLHGFRDGLFASIKSAQTAHYQTCFSLKSKSLVHRMRHCCDRGRVGGAIVDGDQRCKMSKLLHRENNN